jgi:hypothetical protein
LRHLLTWEEQQHLKSLILLRLIHPRRRGWTGPPNLINNLLDNVTSCLVLSLSIYISLLVLLLVVDFCIQLQNIVVAILI